MKLVEKRKETEKIVDEIKKGWEIYSIRSLCSYSKNKSHSEWQKNNVNSFVVGKTTKIKIYVNHVKFSDGMKKKWLSLASNRRQTKREKSAHTKKNDKQHFTWLWIKSISTGWCRTVERECGRARLIYDDSVSIVIVFIPLLQLRLPLSSVFTIQTFDKQMIIFPKCVRKLWKFWPGLKRKWPNVINDREFSLSLSFIHSVRCKQ